MSKSWDFDTGLEKKPHDPDLSSTAREFLLHTQKFVKNLGHDPKYGRNLCHVLIDNIDVSLPFRVESFFGNVN
jgi:hypothetical protein